MIEREQRQCKDATPPYLIAFDLGTTSVRSVIFDSLGRQIASAGRPITQHYPHPGWVEHDPLEILSAQVGTIAEVQYKTGIHSDALMAAGITNQRETTVVWDRHTGQPVYNAIVWQCRRTADMLEKMQREHPDLKQYVQQSTGLVLDPYFSASKIRWILENVPGARERAEAGDLLFGTVDTWLIWNLTGGEVHATDYTNASRTMLFDIHNKRWDTHLLSLFGIPPTMMPQVHSSSHEYGMVATDIMSHATPITGVAGDQQASLFGHACTRPGQIKNTYGTGCFLLMNTGDTPIASQAGLLTSLACNSEGGPAYCLEGSVFVGGAVIQWLRDELGLIDDASETEVLALQVPSTEGVYIVPAFTGLGAPYWDAQARGAIVGLTRGTGRKHIVRAALESMAYQVNDVVDAMHADFGVRPTELRVDGGASTNKFLLQFQSDIMNVDVMRAQTLETTALGAAFLAGLTVGVFADMNQIEELISSSHRVRPTQGEDAIQRRMDCIAGWRAAVKQTLAYR